MRMKRMVLSALVLPLAACTASSGGDALNGPPPPPDAQAAATGLSGTSWQLVAFQSMDDAQGTRRPAPGHEVTLTFEADGKLLARLDCNRGTGSWNEGASLADGAGLTIGPVASTRMLCPEPSMGGLVAMHLSDVTSYMMRDGKLFLALKMDGGIFEWAPLD